MSPGPSLAACGEISRARRRISSSSAPESNAIMGGDKLLIIINSSLISLREKFARASVIGGSSRSHCSEQVRLKGISQRAHRELGSDGAIARGSLALPPPLPLGPCIPCTRAPLRVHTAPGGRTGRNLSYWCRAADVRRSNTHKRAIQSVTPQKLCHRHAQAMSLYPAPINRVKISFFYKHTKFTVNFHLIGNFLMSSLLPDCIHECNLLCYNFIKNLFWNLIAKV